MGMVPPTLLVPFRRRDDQLKEDHPSLYQETEGGMKDLGKRLPVSEHTGEPYDPDLLVQWPLRARVDRKLIGEEYR